MDLIVKEGQTVTLGDQPSPELEQAFSRVPMRTFGDFIEMGVLNKEELEALVSAAHEVTSRTLTSPETFREPRFQPGTRRHNLGRFPAMLAATPTVDRTKMTLFWRLARQEDPNTIVDWKNVREVAKIKLVRIHELVKYFFKDVTIKGGGTLQLTAFDNHLFCDDLVIEKNGKIVCESKTAFISARTIRGEE